MDTDNTNRGINVSGGTFHSDTLAVGDGAQAHKIVYGEASPEQQKRQEILQRLTELEKAIDAHASLLQNANEVRSSTVIVADELKKPQPNKLTLAAILNGIAGSVTSVTAITTAVEALQNALKILL